MPGSGERGVMQARLVLAAFVGLLAPLGVGRLDNAGREPGPPGGPVYPCRSRRKYSIVLLSSCARSHCKK